MSAPLPPPASPAGEDVIARVIRGLPPSLAAFGGRIAPGPGGPCARPAAALMDRAAFDAVVDGFGAAFGAADRRSLVSLWSQYYLAALVIPALTAHVRLGLALPVALGEVGLELDAGGCPARFLLPSEPGCWAARRAPCLSGLIDGHLHPFVELCHRHCGLSRRVLWGNAGVLVDHALRELGGGAPRALPETSARVGWPTRGAWPRSALAQTFQPAPDAGPRRRVCCLRYRLPGVASCGSLCPVDHANRAC